MRKSLLLTVSLLAVLIIVAGCPNKAPRIPAKPSGPALVKFGNTATYVSMTTDPNRDKVLYAFDWGDGTADTTALIKSGDTITQSHAWSAIGVYPVKVIAKDEKGKWSADWSDTLMVTVDSLNPPPNVPPYAPTIVAKHTPLRGIAGGPAYRFYATARDEYDDSLYYRWYFDGTDSVTSPLFPSFTEGYATWTPTGDTHTYTVQVRVFDQTGLTNDSLATTTFKTVAEGEIIWGYEAEFVTSPAIGTTHWKATPGRRLSAAARMTTRACVCLTRTSRSLSTSSPSLTRRSTTPRPPSATMVRGTSAMRTAGSTPSARMTAAATPSTGGLARATAA